MKGLNKKRENREKMVEKEEFSCENRYIERKVERYSK
jgi:hypothetical protein